MKKNIIIVVVVAVLLVLMLSIGESKASDYVPNYIVENIDGKDIYTIENTSYIKTEEETNIVIIDVVNFGMMVAELYPDIAPITVANFKSLVSDSFYDGLTFHRVIKDFMIQAGDPTGTGAGGSDNTIKGEFSKNGIENNLSHTYGVLSMARQSADEDTEQTMNSASSQFFIVQDNCSHLDGSYAAFGKVINGLEVIDAIAEVSTNSSDKPLEDVVIKTIEFAREYKEGE